MNPLSNNHTDILQRMTQLSSLLLFHYLLKSLTLLSPLATRGPWFIWLNSFVFPHPPSPHLRLCPAALNEPLQGHQVSVSRPWPAQVTHSFFISSLVQKKTTKKKEMLVDSHLPSSLPPSLAFSSNPQGDGRE